MLSREEDCRGLGLFIFHWNMTTSMKALGVSFAKRLNKFFKSRGQVYKTRFHLRILRSASEVKNVINYILKNGIKHKRAKSFMDPYNSWVVLHDFRILGLKYKKLISAYSKIPQDYGTLRSKHGQFTMVVALSCRVNYELCEVVPD